MSYLPNEILNLIFTLLVQQDKLECMTVCQQWHDVIYHQSLFSTIFIDNQQQLDKLVEKVENDYILGTKVQIYPSLKELSFSYIDFETGTDTFISRVFPNLKRLKMKNCLKDGDSFILPNTYLSYLEIRNLYSDGASPIMVITLDNGQTRLYNATKKSIFAEFDPDDVGEDLSTFSPVYSQPFNASTAVPKLTIVCKSVFNFFMVNYDIIYH